MNDIDFIKSLEQLLRDKKQKIMELEFTSGNYDTDGKLIDKDIPTITTDFCEIGRYKNEMTYFTIILYPDIFNEKIFNDLKRYNNLHIYGFINFLEDYYPKSNFSYKNFEKDIKTDKYMQIQFNFDKNYSKPEDVVKKYFEIKEIFDKNKVTAINQIAHNFK